MRPKICLTLPWQARWQIACKEGKMVIPRSSSIRLIWMHRFHDTLDIIMEDLVMTLCTTFAQSLNSNQRKWMSESKFGTFPPLPQPDIRDSQRWLQDLWSVLEVLKHLWRHFNNLKRLQLFFGVMSVKTMYMSDLSEANLKPQSKRDSQTDGASATLRHLKLLSKATPEAPFWSDLWLSLLYFQCWETMLSSGDLKWPIVLSYLIILCPISDTYYLNQLQLTNNPIFLNSHLASIISSLQRSWFRKKVRCMVGVCSCNW
jgi:hypothetical protein